MKKRIKEFMGLFEKELAKSLPKQEVAKPRRKIKINRKTSISEDTILKDIKASIKKSGCKSLTVGGLFRAFGHKRRGGKNTGEINKFLSDNKLYCYPPLSRDLAWNKRIAIYNFPVERRGDLFKNERLLQQELFNRNTLLQLKIDSIVPEFSPNNTRDRLDFFAKDGERNVVIEVKNKGGGKRAVEQVLRYSGMLKQQYPEVAVRKILITGKQDQHTAKAIHGMTNEERNLFEWFLYEHDKTTGDINLKKVDYELVFTYFSAE